MIEHQQTVSDQSWNLVPLTPEYLEAEHGRYVEAIETALADKQIRNIALSGNYGVGKSSILREVSRRQDGRVVELSLSTLAPIEVSKLDDSVPKQATTPTNRIQQEIVKQLLYRENPSKTPGSRFRRIERFQWKRVILASVMMGFIIATIFLLTGWALQINSAVIPKKNIGPWIHAIIWGMATVITLLVSWLFYGKLRIKQFSAGSATVTLDDNSVSYFDQYLDEIVYFFEVSDRDVVIFEDIDRFNDSHIFETLRALNTLLNASPQIEKPVRFIYAIKDSIFDRIGMEAENRRLEKDIFTTDDAALAEAMRANRTKFFDLVIPVVPFITHRSARNLAVQLLSEIEHKIAPELLDLAAQYVPDMRLLKNVCNEFIVFRDRIFSGDGKQLNLSETNLFAMMLYKSTHLTDFETIRLGTSMLDILYKISRKLVTENIKRIEQERRELIQRVAQIDGVSVRSVKLGEQLIEHVQRIVKLVNFRKQYETYSLVGIERTLDDLKGEQFWTEFVSSNEELVLIWQNGSGQALKFNRAHLAAELGDPLDAKVWNKEVRDTITEQINEKGNAIKFLRSADLSELLKRPEFLVNYKGVSQSFEEIVKTILKLGLAYQLIRAGYINSSFTLYTSTFHGDRVGTAATNFIIHHVERNLMDENFELSPADVDAIIRERGKNALKEPALYNISILDRLLMTDIDAADIMINSLANLEEIPRQFLQAYLSAGEQCLRFIERFTVLSPKTLVYLVSQVELDDVSRLQFVDIALVNLPPSKLHINSIVSEYLSMHYEELTALTSDKTDPIYVERICLLFSDANIKVPHLELLSQKVFLPFVSRSLYEITYENLKLAIGYSNSVALDVIRTANETVYSYVLRNLNAYLEAIEGLSVTINSNEYFLVVIEDVLKHEASRLDDVLEHAASDCEIVDIGDVSEEAWAALAEYRRFPATFGNVSKYVATLGEVDSYLAKVLSKTVEIIEADTADEESKIILAIALITSKTQLPSAKLRAKLVESLELNEYLSVDKIAAETGQLFPLLLNYNIISDSSKSYEYLATTDWPTREMFISMSNKFLSYMTPKLVNTDLAMLLRSDKINLHIKQKIVEQAIEYLEEAESQGLSELARFASQRRDKLPIETVQHMAHKGIATQQILQLLEPHLTSIHCDHLFKILQVIGGDYSKLTAPGRDKPRIPNTPADLALLKRLQEDGIVSKYDENESPMKVHKRYK